MRLIGVDGASVSSYQKQKFKSLFSMKFTLVIPTYNEAPVIRETVEILRKTFEKEFVPAGHQWCILIADNASTDGTALSVRDLNDPRVLVCELKQKGKGNAVRKAFETSDADIIGFTDADLSVSLENIVKAFLAVSVGDANLVIGSRMHKDSIQPNREWWRVWSSNLFNSVVRNAMAISYRDTQCPLKVMDREVKDVFLETHEQTWFFDFEFLALAKRLGYYAKEIPISWDEHRYVNRKSKLSTTRDGIRAIFAIIRVRWRLSKQVAKIQETDTMGNMVKWIIVGLGNPGPEYTKTRHNAGRIVLEHLGDAYGFSNWIYKKTYEALCAKGEIEGHEILLLEPETYMNESGRSLKTLVKTPEQMKRLVVIHDDIDVPIGEWKMSFDRGSGGHNGIKSIMSVLKSNAFLRIRIGILPNSNNNEPQRKPAGHEETSKFVVGKFRPDELAKIQTITSQVKRSVEVLITKGKDVAMKQSNTKSI